MTPAWWICWACGCDDAQPNKEDLPDTCPHHDRQHGGWPIEPPDYISRALNLGHWCINGEDWRPEAA